LDVRTGIHDPLNNFEGRLELHTNFYDNLACSWDLDQSLCADEPCDSLILGFQNWGGALVVGDFQWRLEDENAAIVDSGSFTMTANNQYWFRGLCVEPGSYTYSLTALTSPSGGGPTLTVSNSTSFASPTMSTPLDWFNDPGAQIEFPFFEFCVQNPNSVERPVSENEIQVLRNGNDVVLQSKEVVKSAFVYSTNGRLVETLNPNSNRFQLLSGLQNGIYLIQVETVTGLTSVKVLK
jgi:hypothetical protein